VTLSHYNKPWLSYSDQVALLQQRGLRIQDVPAAKDFLEHVNYYRFSGYCLAFEKSRHCFRPGTTFEQVQAAYDFDRVLRDVVTEGLEVIEVDLRTRIAYHFGQQYGAFGHTDPNNFFLAPPQFSKPSRSAKDHDSWTKKLHAEAKRSSERFVTHFRKTYREFPDLPIWVITETMSFGTLSRLYNMMLKKDLKAIAGYFQIQPNVLTSWMHHATYVRNLCAHHARLWDRRWTITPQLAYGSAWRDLPNRTNATRLFVTLLILYFLMGKSPAAKTFAGEWQARVESLLLHPPAVPNAATLMGLPPTWQNHPLWK